MNLSLSSSPGHDARTHARTLTLTAGTELEEEFLAALGQRLLEKSADVLLECLPSDVVARLDAKLEAGDGS